jgi:hypothetical protein
VGGAVVEDQVDLELVGDRTLGRVEIDADDVSDVLDPVRLEPERPPDL